MQTITPCLWFDTQAQEAAEFYVSVFPNSSIRKVTHYTSAVPQREGDVLTVEFELDGRPFTALNGGPEFTFSEAVSFQVPCADQAEVDHYWSVLSEGGKQGPCGWLSDRFGLSWQVVPTELLTLIEDPEHGAKVTEAMFAMGKLDIEALRAAAR